MRVWPSITGAVAASWLIIFQPEGRVRLSGTSLAGIALMFLTFRVYVTTPEGTRSPAAVRVLTRSYPLKRTLVLRSRAVGLALAVTSTVPAAVWVR
ncbi:MAG: hypothetical protein AB9888_00220 [Bacteroidales bacterium]